MCGRIFQTLSLQRLIAIARATNVNNAEGYNSSYNICPTSYIPAIRNNRKFKATEKTQELVEDIEKENK
jgi:putative SOS response-associated peptidase YedK